MSDQQDIDALLASATQLAAEAGSELGLAAAEHSAEWPGPSSARAGPPLRAEADDLNRILHMAFPIIVTLAERTMQLKDVLELTPGAMIKFDRVSDAELNLEVGNRRIGSGQAVKVGECYGLRVTSIGPVEERIRAMGG